MKVAAVLSCLSQKWFGKRQWRKMQKSLPGRGREQGAGKRKTLLKRAAFCQSSKLHLAKRASEKENVHCKNHFDRQRRGQGGGEREKRKSEESTQHPAHRPPHVCHSVWVCVPGNIFLSKQYCKRDNNSRIISLAD